MDGQEKKWKKNHYYNDSLSRQTCAIVNKLGSGYTISGAPVNFPSYDGVAFKYIYSK